MKQLVSQTMWSCDHRKCKAHSTSDDPQDTPPRWTSITGSIQEPTGGGPAGFDLCPKHTKVFHATYSIHTDTED